MVSEVDHPRVSPKTLVVLRIIMLLLLQLTADSWDHAVLKGDQNWSILGVKDIF